MTVHEVNEIMGKPDSTTLFPFDSLRFNFLYYSPVGMSDNFYVFFSKKDSLVVAIGDGS